ncbi:hypothetical protein [Bdellovibrio sp. BCCA]|uniref:hypothetical protein n=1 Tax=Bdellovibrio sp. BCCA TaxID=3136281 RepID=UPI0030F2E11D
MRYGNLSENSGVIAFEINEDSIAVQFIDGSIYLYNYQRPGRKHVEEMKRRARSGKGLSTYISQHVRENYVLKIS